MAGKRGAIVYINTAWQRKISSKGLLSKEFKPQDIETILSLKYCNLIRKQSERAEDYISCLRIKANECKYKKNDRGLKEQFINGINKE